MFVCTGRTMNRFIQERRCFWMLHCVYTGVASWSRDVTCKSACAGWLTSITMKQDFLKKQQPIDWFNAAPTLLIRKTPLSGRSMRWSAALHQHHMMPESVTCLGCFQLIWFADLKMKKSQTPHFVSPNIKGNQRSFYSSWGEPHGTVSGWPWEPLT